MSLLNTPRPSSLLALAPYPKLGEHPGSYVRRVALDNGYDTIGDLLKRLGVGAEVDRFVGSRWQHIIDATGIDSARFDPLDLEPRTPGAPLMVDVDGASVPAGFIDRRFLRSCPACLMEDGFLQKRFAIRHVTACTRHSVTLSDECACGRKRLALDRTFLWRCPACGLDSTEMPAEPASPNQMLAAQLMDERSPIEDVDGVPDQLFLLAVSDRIAVVERLGAVVLAARYDEPVTRVGGIVRTPVRSVSRSRRLHDDRAIVEAAMPLLLGWPVSYRTLLNDLLDRNPDGEGRSLLLSRFGTAAGRLALGKVIGAEGRTIDFVEAEKLAFLRDAIGYEPYWKTTPKPNKGFATTEANRIAGRAERLVNGREFQRRLGYGKSETIAAWSRAGLIKATVHPNGAAQLSRSDLDDLLAWFTALPAIDRDDGDYVPFRSEVPRYSRGFYDREELLRDVFAKALRVGRLDDGSEGLGP